MSALARFQASWSASTSAPLRFLVGGRAEVPEEDYDPGLLSEILPTGGVDAAARLGAYRKQYWFRLITLMQKDFPLVGHLLGWEDFNPLAAGNLLDHPPTGDLGRLGETFPGWLKARGVPAHVVEASRVDLAWNLAFSAGALPMPSEADLGRLASGEVSIALQPSVRILSVNRDWFPLRIALSGEEEVPSGPPAPRRGNWVVSRTGSVLHAEPVDSRLGSLLRSMRRLSWTDALGRLVEGHPETTGRIAEWFSIGQTLGWWAVVED